MHRKIAYIETKYNTDGSPKNKTNADTPSNASIGPKEESNPNTRNIHDHPEHLTEILIAIGTGVIAWFTFGLFWDAKNKGIRELRAYVGIVAGEISYTTDGKLLGWMSFRNTGKTPAHDLTSWIDHGVRDKDSIKESLFPKKHDEGKGGVLVPGVTWTRHLLIDLTNLNWDDLDKETETVWVWGGIDYRDSFGEPCHVSYRFWTGNKRFRLNDHGQPEKYWPLIPSKHGNKATYGDKTPS